MLSKHLNYSILLHFKKLLLSSNAQEIPNKLAKRNTAINLILLKLLIAEVELNILKSKVHDFEFI